MSRGHTLLKASGSSKSESVAPHVCVCSLLGVRLVAFVRQAIVRVASIVGATSHTPHIEE